MNIHRRTLYHGGLVVGVGLALVTMLVYVHTLSPNWGAISEFNTWDGLEYTLCAKLLGIDHPPGHPFYLLLGKLLTLASAAPATWLLNLFSALGGMLCVILLYYGLMIVTRHRVGEIPSWWRRTAAAALALAFGFSYVYWSHCVITEVHTLFLALLAGMIAGVLKWHETDRNRWLNLAAVCAGLALGVNLLGIAAAVVPTVIFVIPAACTRQRGWKTLILPACLFLCGSLSYLYYPIRLPHLSFTHPMNLMAPHPPGSAGWYRWYLSGSSWTAGSMFFLRRVGFNLGIYTRFLRANLGIPLIVLVICGMGNFITHIRHTLTAATKERDRRKRSSGPGATLSPLLIPLFLLLLFLFIALPELSIHDPSNPAATDYLANFFLPSLMVLFYWASLGLTSLYRFAQARLDRHGIRRFALVSAAALVALPAWQFARNYPRCNLSNNDAAYVMAREAVTRLPEESLVLSKLVYPQVAAYFSSVEPLISPDRFSIISPDEVAYRLAQESDPATPMAGFARKNRELLSIVGETRATGGQVFIAGDAVEIDKSPEKMLLSDLEFSPWEPLRPVQEALLGEPRELTLYEIEGFRKAAIANEDVGVIHEGIANNGRFANGLRLRGYASEPRANRNHGGVVLDLHLLWEEEREITDSLYVIVNVLDGRMVSLPGAATWYTLGGRFPPAQWPAGKTVEEKVSCLLPPLRPGQYLFALGLVDAHDRRIRYLPGDHAQTRRTYEYVLVAPFVVMPVRTE